LPHTSAVGTFTQRIHNVYQIDDAIGVNKHFFLIREIDHLWRRLLPLSLLYSNDPIRHSSISISEAKGLTRRVCERQQQRQMAWVYDRNGVPQLISLEPPYDIIESSSLGTTPTPLSWTTTNIVTSSLFSTTVENKHSKSGYQQYRSYIDINDFFHNPSIRRYDGAAKAIKSKVTMLYL
jgi:hypothetical protein